MPDYTPQDLHEMAIAAAQAHGVDPDLFTNMIRQESGFNPHARSSAGAVGIAQIVPKYHPGVDPTDPAASLSYSAGMIANGVKKYGSYERALSAYNSGSPDAYQDPHFANGQTYNYVRSIMHASGQPASGGQAGDAGTQAQAAPMVSDYTPPAALQPNQNGVPMPAWMGRHVDPLAQQVDQQGQALLQQGAQQVPNVQAAPTLSPQQAQQNAQGMAAGFMSHPQQPAPQTNFLGDLWNHAANAATGYTQDPLIQNSGHGIGATVGDIVGPIIPIGGASLGAGALTEGVGAIPAGIAAAGGEGTAQALQQQRLAHQPMDLLKAGGQGLIQAGLQALPVLKGASALEAIAKNALLHGGAGATASLGIQAIEQGTLTPHIDLGQVEQMAALAGAGGAVAGGMHGKAMTADDMLARQNYPDTLSKSEHVALDKITTPEHPEPLNRQTAQQSAPIPKSAAESADVFNKQAENVSTAEQVLNDATLARATAEQKLTDTTGEADPVQAQRALGQRILDVRGRVEAGETISPEEGTQIHQDMTLLDEVLKSREQERLAHEMYEQEQQPTKRADLPTEADPLAPQTAEPLSRPTGDLTPAPDLIKDNVVDISGQPKGLLGPNGKPLESSVEAGVGRSAVWRNADGDIPVNVTGDLGIYNGRKYVSIEGSKTGIPEDELVYKQAAQPTAETLNPEKPITQEMQDAVTGAKHQLLTIADAERHIRQYQPDQMQHFLNAAEAGKNNQTLDVTHSPLEGGGRVTNEREVNPVGFTKQTIQGRTEVANLRKQFEGDLNQVRDNLVKRLNDAGVKVSAAEQKIAGNKGDVIRLNALADKLPDIHRTHVYIMDHNLGETARKEGTYGFRRLDRISDSSLTGKTQELPAGTKYQNKIPAAYQALKEMIDRSDAPATLKRVAKQLDSGNISKRSFNDLVAAYKEYAKLTPDDWAKFCKGLGL